MSAQVELAIGYDCPVPVAGLPENTGLIGGEFDVLDASYGIVFTLFLAVSTWAVIGWMVYVLAW